MNTPESKTIEEFLSVAICKVDDLRTIFKSLSRLPETDKNTGQLAAIGYVMADDLVNDLDIFIEENSGT